jgi:hypothetical protein
MQDRWCVMTEERIYFFESFWASKYSKPTEAVPLSRVVGVQLTRNSAGSCVLNVIYRSRLFGAGIIQFSLSEERAATVWGQCFAKMESLAFSSTVLDEKKPEVSGEAGMTIGLSSMDLMELESRLDEPQPHTLKRVDARAILFNQELTKLCESDSESDVVSADFIEVYEGGHNDVLRSMPYGKDLCCADMCSYYQKMVANGDIQHGLDACADEELPKSDLGRISVQSTTVNEASNEFPSFEIASTTSWD